MTCFQYKLNLQCGCSFSKGFNSQVWFMHLSLDISGQLAPVEWTISVISIDQSTMFHWPDLVRVFDDQIFTQITVPHSMHFCSPVQSYKDWLSIWLELHKTVGKQNTAFWWWFGSLIGKTLRGLHIPRVGSSNVAFSKFRLIYWMVFYSAFNIISVLTQY